MSEETPWPGPDEQAAAIKTVIESIIEQKKQAGTDELEAQMLVIDAILAAATDEDGFLAQRRLPDGRLLGVTPQTYGAAQLGIGEKPPMENVGVWADAWDFPTRAAARKAFEEWDPETEPEPTGWHRHYKTGRYRTDGDPKLEYVRWEGSVEGQWRHAIQVVCGNERVILEAVAQPSLFSGTQVFTITSTTRTNPSSQWVDFVYHYLDRCVVVQQHEMESGSADTIAQSVTYRLTGHKPDKGERIV